MKSNANETGTARACAVRMMPTGSTSASACPRHATFRVTAETRSISATIATLAAAIAGTSSRWRDRRSRSGRRCRPSRHIRVSFPSRVRSAQSLTTSQIPISAMTSAGAGATSPSHPATASAASTASPRCHSWMRRSKTKRRRPSLCRSTPRASRTSRPACRPGRRPAAAVSARAIAHHRTLA